MKKIILSVAALLFRLSVAQAQTSDSTAADYQARKLKISAVSYTHLDVYKRQTETIQYTVHVADRELNCQASATMRVSVGLCTIFAPDAFTPNDDGHNDVFFLEGSSCVELIKELVIYDRWGEVICRKENFLPSKPSYGWDGMNRSHKAETGLYDYKATVSYRTGTAVSYTHLDVYKRQL